MSLAQAFNRVLNQSTDASASVEQVEARVKKLRRLILVDGIPTREVNLSPTLNSVEHLLIEACE